MVKFLDEIFGKRLIFRIRYFFFKFKEVIFFFNYTNKDIFTYIYKKGIWGSNKYPKKNPFFSGVGSHSKNLINPYINFVKKFLRSIKKPVIVDAGCGDFNIGKHFISEVEKYYAIDIVDDLINFNKKKFIYKNLFFKKKDITKSTLPKGDVLIVRQVLQHLNNKDINSFLSRIKNRFKYLIITEEFPSSRFIPNIDKKTGSDVRFNSGVKLHDYPFNMVYSKKKIVLNLKIRQYGLVRIIQTIFYKF